MQIILIKTIWNWKKRKKNLKDTLPLTEQQPVRDAAILPVAHANISALSSSLYPFLNAKLFSARRVSAIITTATVILVPRHDTTSTDAKSGSDDALRLIPVTKFSLEGCLEFLAPDELLEVTPENLRIRKRILDHDLRMKATSKKNKG